MNCPYEIITYGIKGWFAYRHCHISYPLTAPRVKPRMK